MHVHRIYIYRYAYISVCVGEGYNESLRARAQVKGRNLEVNFVAASSIIERRLFCILPWMYVGVI